MNTNQLMQAVVDRKCVVWGPGIRSPLAFIASMQFSRVMDMLPTMKIYTKKQQTKSKKV